MPKQIKKGLALALVAMAACANALAAYPDHPIHLIVPFTAGGGVDIIGRETAKILGEELKQSVVVENKPGAASNLGAGYVAHSPGDGYTLLMASGSLAVNRTLFKNTGFDAVHDFVRVARVAQAPSVLVVNSKSPFHSLKDLIDYGRSNPKQVSFASTGYGSNQHLNGEIITSDGDFQAVHVPYKGGPPALTDLIAGRTTFFMTVPAEVFGFLKSGKLRPLAVSGRTRMTQLPDVPTLLESGLKDEGLGSWWAVAAPKGTPQAVVDKLSNALMKALAEPQVKQAILGLGMEPAPLDAKQFDAFFLKQVKEYAGLIKKYHIPRQ
ncbi:tripartite tricarboxylate transporter substrate binding protein [Candidimonas humi]|uniref:Bug family tripartite tricarboxylate transporter substrate binding protein n=1 Tax=Candidimonas humi TaxID=683355 RepID=A0ABV8NUW4_9BURK|nr:tripartite tricarboxylate transporter substrate binding protein [Candidimonas humi]MBV6303354.1 tripartite tricarboxylate transporter substrate binding protein [Candidimonas humi]